jgi:hypothetical protein
MGMPHREHIMSNEQKSQDQQQGGQPAVQGQAQGQQGAQQQAQPQSQQQGQDPTATTDVDGLANKKPEELTPEELRLMADTMPGEGPGD